MFSSPELRKLLRNPSNVMACVENAIIIRITRHTVFVDGDDDDEPRQPRHCCDEPTRPCTHSSR